MPTNQSGCHRRGCKKRGVFRNANARKQTRAGADECRFFRLQTWTNGHKRKQPHTNACKREQTQTKAKSKNCLLCTPFDCSLQLTSQLVLKTPRESWLLFLRALKRIHETGTMRQIGVCTGKPCTFLVKNGVIFGIFALQK